MKTLFTLIKKTGLDKSSIEQLEQFAHQVQENVKTVVQYIEPKLESGLEIIRKESDTLFNEMLKDLKPLDEVVKEDFRSKSINDMCFQDFLEFNGVTWNRFKLLSGKYNQKQTRDFAFNTSCYNWLNLAFSWTTDEGEEFWEDLHYQWKECCNYAIDKDIQIIFNHEEKESPEYFTKEDIVESKKEHNESKLIGDDKLKLKVLNLEKFLEAKLVKIDNFRNYVIEEHSSIKIFKQSDFEVKSWIDEAFEWDSTEEEFNFWDDINSQWVAEVQEAIKSGTRIKFGFKKEVLNFKKFLKSKGKLKPFKHHVKDSNFYLTELSDNPINDWLETAFSWDETTISYEEWNELNNQWLDEVSNARNANVDIVFGFKV